MKRFKQRFTGHQISVSMIMWLIAFASLTCGAGITYAVLKNDQIQVARDIKQMNEEIASCELTKEYYRSKTSSLTSRWPSATDWPRTSPICSLSSPQP